MRNFKTKFGTLKEGLKVVHIGQDTWLFGKQKNILGKGLHMVIYGPDRKEYHLWNEDVQKLMKENCYVNRHGNFATEEKVKIYILTSILDKTENWCFDLMNTPTKGPLKVICENGTVRNIEFDGQFLPQELISKRFTDMDRGYEYRTFVNIVGYRKF